jgi:hypothetical protein
VDFLTNQIFSNKWTNYQNLSLAIYGGETMNFKKFGELQNRKDVQQFIKEQKQVSFESNEQKQSTLSILG